MLQTVMGYIQDLNTIGETVIADDSIFTEVAKKLNIYAKNKHGKYINSIKVSRLGCGITRLYY